jgi:hypothetical protein
VVLAFVNKLMMIERDLVKQYKYSVWLKSWVLDGTKPLECWMVKVQLYLASLIPRAFQTARICCAWLLRYSRPGADCGLESKVKLLFMRLLSWGCIGPCKAVVHSKSSAGKAVKGVGPGLLSVSYALSKSEDQSG